MKLISYFIICVVFISCNKTNTKRIVNEGNSGVKIVTENKSVYHVYEWTHNKHTYILIERNGNCSITHAGHCTCRNEE